MITDDNPFDDLNDDNTGAFGGNDVNDAPPPRPPKAETYTPPARPPKPDTTTTTTTTSSTSIDIADYERRLAELERRERAVAERERKVAKDQDKANEQMEAAQKVMESGGGAAGDKPAPNWPPCLPKKIAYIDFEAEIPEILRTRTKMAYVHFIVSIVIFIYNIVCAIACLVAVATEPPGAAIGDLILACIYLPFLSAMFFIVFRRLYKACKSGSSLSYFMFFIGFTIEIIICIIALVGPQRSGFMGIIWTVSAFSENGNQAVGFMCLVNSILFGASAGFMIYLWIHTRVNFQQAGGIKEMRKQAVEKATMGAIKAAKEHPDAAKKVGKAAVNYARENPDVIKDAAAVAYGASHGGGDDD